GDRVLVDIDFNFLVLSTALNGGHSALNDYCFAAGANGLRVLAALNFMIACAVAVIGADVTGLHINIGVRMTVFVVDATAALADLHGSDSNRLFAVGWVGMVIVVDVIEVSVSPDQHFAVVEDIGLSGSGL